jgi:hypothetical protein
MTVTPLVPGRLYRCKSLDLDIKIIATDPVEALQIALNLISKIDSEFLQ